VKFSTFGLDTVAIGFYGLGGSDVCALLDDAPALRHSRGHLLTTEHDSGARVIWYPGSLMVKVEGRLSPMVEGSKSAKRLATRAELLELPGLASKVVSDVTGFDARELRRETSYVTRLDVTGELEFARPADGLAFLRATSGLVPPGYKGAPIYSPDGQVQTMRAITSKKGRKVATFYDSGLKHGTAAPGELVRYEVQNRWPKASERTAAELSLNSQTLPSIFARHLEPFTDYAKEITVTTATDAPGQIAQLLAQGKLTRRQANGLAGFVSMLPHGGRQLYGDRPSRRYLRELRRVGVVLSGTEQDAALTIGQGLQQLLDGAYAASGAQEPAVRAGVLA